MKKFTPYPALIILFAILFYGNIYSQTGKCGVYLTAKDFQNKKLSYAFEFKGKHHKVTPDIVIGKNNVKIKYQDSIYTLDIKKVYALKLSDENITRIFNGQAYQVLNPDENIILYKAVPNTPGVNPTSTTYYYFSKNVTGPVRDLTMKNLKEAFPGKEKFYYNLQLEFPNEQELARYDAANKEYYINEVLEDSEK